MSSLLKKILRNKRIPVYIIFDIFYIIVSILIEHLYEEIEIWFISYFFIYLIFCVAIFFKQYDEDYLYGLHQYTDLDFEEWILLFGCMLFPGWLAGPAFLDFLGFQYGEVSYTESMIPLMLVYPLVFYIFPFRKALKEKYEKRIPPSKKGRIFLKIFTTMALYIFTIYLQVFYFTMMSDILKGYDIASMDLVGRVVLFLVSMMAMAIMYLPARIHYFFEFYGSRENKISFFITVVLIGIYAMTGFDVL